MVSLNIYKLKLILKFYITPQEVGYTTAYPKRMNISETSDRRVIFQIPTKVAGLFIRRLHGDFEVKP